MKKSFFLFLVYLDLQGKKDRLAHETPNRLPELISYIKSYLRIQIWKIF